MALVLAPFVLSACGSAHTGPDEYGAKSACQEFVERHLKSPSTAEFETEATGGPTRFTVTGTVDSQNSFGGTVRNEFTCVTTAGDKVWTLESLTGLGG